MEIYGSFNEMVKGTGALSLTVEGMTFVGNMSPIVDRFKGYSILIQGGDHDPPHVHIKRGDEKLGKLPISPSPVNNRTTDTTHIPKGDLNELWKHIEENSEMYLKKWKENFGD